MGASTCSKSQESKRLGGGHGISNDLMVSLVVGDI